jgi:prepilin-type N-terminal cleavage/methylation domain-containing protein
MDNKQDKGFTLVELLIVIVILGILATVTVFAVRGITTQGQEASCKAGLKTVATAVEAYSAQEGAYPANIGELEAAGLLRPAQGGTTADFSFTTDGAGNVQGVDDCSSYSSNVTAATP